jgi:DNA invertase Pin-like site-specific DNA recombinase
MSDDSQNDRSPQQQRDNIDERRRRLGRPWVIVRDYEDAGIKGRLTRKRPGLQSMLRDIRSGAIVVDAILVDKYERFGRLDEMQKIRDELYRKHGVVVLTADSGFADPTDVAGKALAMCEGFRAREDNRIKAHNVLRGKRDAAKQKHWPGGRPPLGLKRMSVMTEKHGREEVDHVLLEPEPETAWIPLKAFQLAYDTGWGGHRLSQALNNDPTIPDQYKPFTPNKLNNWFKNTLYKGALTYGMVSTDFVDDSRIARRNPAEEVLYIPDFCEPIVPPELWDAVAEIRHVRRVCDVMARALRRQVGDKQIAPLIPGVALKFLLSGLLRCGTCGLRMAVNGTKPYTTAAGEERHYVYYVCPARASGGCPNRIRIPETWLRQVVIDLVRRRLFPVQD